MLTWIVETCINENTSQSLIQAIKDHGHDLKTILFIPHQGITIDASINDLIGPIIFYGSIQGCDFIQKKTSFFPGTFADFPKYECLNYYPYLAPFLLNQDYIMLPFGDISRRKDWITELMAEDGCIFVRPNSCTKSFVGQVIDVEAWDNEAKYLARCEIESNELVVIARPYNIQREWRMIVSGDKVITGSQYKEKGQSKQDPEVPSEVFGFTQEILNIGFSPDIAWVIDVCEVHDEMKILEIGSVSCCGLYCCDVNKFVEAVSAAAFAAWDDVYNSEESAGQHAIGVL